MLNLSYVVFFIQKKFKCVCLDVFLSNVSPWLLKAFYMLLTVIWKVWLGTVLSWQHWWIVSTKRLFPKVDSSRMFPEILRRICVSPSAQGTHCNSPDTSGNSMQWAARSISCHLLRLGLPQRARSGYALSPSAACKACSLVCTYAANSCNST